MTDTADRLDGEQLDPVPYRWLGPVRTTLFVLGAASVLIVVAWQLSGNFDPQLFPFALFGCLCLVGGVNAMVWGHLLAHRDPALTARQRRTRTIAQISAFALASVIVVGSLMLLGLTMFFWIMNTSSGA